MAWVPAVIGAAGSIIGGLISSGGQDKTNATNIQLQKSQQDWEEKMSNTEVQRRQADLKAAGINPMIAGGVGGSASTPNVAPARIDNASAGLGAGVMSAGQAAASAYIAAKQGSLLDAQTTKTNAEAASAIASAPYAGQAAKGSADIATQTASNLSTQYQILDMQYKKTYLEAQAIIQGMQSKDIDIETARKLQPYLIQLKETEAQAAKLGLPQLKNAAAAQDSWWMRKVSPYLPDLLKSTGAASSARGLVK